MGHFFYPASSLPTLYFGVRPDITFFQFLELVQENLCARDLKKLSELREYIDILNIKRLLKGRSIDTRGNLREKELDEALIEREGFHPTVIAFLDKYESIEDRLAHFVEMLSLFLRAKADEAHGFMKKYFEHEWMLRLSLAAYRCIRNKSDVVEELKHEDPKDPFIAMLLAQKDASQFEFPFELENLTDPLAAAIHPIDEYKAIFEHQFIFAESEGQGHLFSLEYLMAYMLQLLAIENWEATNEQTGIGIIEGMV